MIIHTPVYREYPPSEPLAPYIDKYWEFEGHAVPGMRMNVLADGCTDFIFTLGEAVQATDDTLVMRPYRVYFVGPLQEYSQLVSHVDAVHMLGVRFLPGGLSRFMKIPLRECVNRRLGVNELEDPVFEDSFAGRLAECPDFPARIVWIEKMLTRRLCTYGGISDPRISYAVTRINSHRGNLSIRHLTGDICLGQRHFERQFQSCTGFSPKRYSRIVKFRHAVGLLRDHPPGDLLSVALKAGYFDVPHLSREVKCMSGRSPGAFLLHPQEGNLSLFYLE